VTPKKGWVREWTETLVVALALALLIRTFAMQVFFIPSGSMEPTLDIGDRIIVNKLTFKFHEPSRFEIAVFRFPYGKPGEESKDFIKRVLGMPGETLQVKDGVVYINGKPLAEKHTMNKDMANYGPVQIPSDSYFMMGDNRPNSADSRYWGFLPKQYMIGPAVVRIWPLTRFGLLKDRAL
jgi:signal peptidase I